MSYILDALKKSDSERKQGDVPNLQTVHIPIELETKTPKILYGFISVLLLVLALMLGMIISDNKTDIVFVKEESHVTEKADLDRSTSDVLKQKNQSNVVSQQTITNKKSQLTEPKPVPVQKNSSVKPSTPKEAHMASEKKPAIVQQKQNLKKKTVNLSEVPFLHEMPEYVQQSIPQMNFAGHVYSTDSKNRSVIINNHAMSEGDVLVEGLDVVEITPSGVVFSFQGELFRVDILQDWSFE